MAIGGWLFSPSLSDCEVYNLHCRTLSKDLRIVYESKRYYKKEEPKFQCTEPGCLSQVLVGTDSFSLES